MGKPKPFSATTSSAASSQASGSLLCTLDPAAELSSAERRVAEFLRALGLVDAPRVAALSASIARDSMVAQGGSPRAEDAVAHAQSRVEDFLRSVFGQRAAEVEPLWLRAFVQACPEVFLADTEVARAAARQFGDPWQGRPPSRAHFREQKLGSLHLPSWLSGLLAPWALTALATASLVYGLSEPELSALELLWSGLFFCLFGFSALGFFTSLRGFLQPAEPHAAEGTPQAEAMPRSAVVMPIYHEDAEQVFAAIAAMRDSLAQVPGGEALEFFVLSDSRNPVTVAEEERAWRRIAVPLGEPNPVFYRRRARNEHQKAGNLAEFLERWGHRYEYAIVLDADSLMSGDTMLELVRRMHGSPQLGLLQAPLNLHRGATLFSRGQQFAASVSGPLSVRGLAAWAGDQGNYYGHNAILRVRAFLDCCALPTLAGKPPLGGNILSHDFVEAALLCRAGWHVRLATDLESSWEELPPTLPEYVARDRRWCQGNLQHLRIAFTAGLAPMSRIHMLTGVGAYLAGPAWLAFIAVGLLLASQPSVASAPAGLAISLTLATACLLIGPRLLGCLSCLRDPDLRRLHGGSARLLWSTLCELVLAALLAPLMMVHHSLIVGSVLIGRTTSWGPQGRTASAPWAVLLRSELPATLLGLGLFGWLWQGPTPLLWSLAPIWLPLSLSIPLAGLASSRGVGQLAGLLGMFRVPCETQPDPLTLAADEARVLTATDEASRYRDLVLDPLLVHAQLVKLGPDQRPTDPERERVQRLRARALRGGPASLSSDDWEAVIHDADSLRWLHREAWRHWPVETWNVAREPPQLPPDDRGAAG